MVNDYIIDKYIGLLRKKYKYLVFYSITMAIYFISFIILGIYSDDLPSKLQ